MNLVVFTTVLGETDPLRPIRQPNPAVRYLCFADQPLHAAGWDVIRIAPDPPVHIQSRRLKILAHETLALWRPDISLWMDAAFELHADPVAVAREWLDGVGSTGALHPPVDMVALKHPHRCRIADEGAQIVHLGYATADGIAQQLAAARAAGFPLDAQAAITSTGFCLRRHTDAVRRFNDRWWELFVTAGHGRDQMSVDWALWDSPVVLRYLDGHYKDNPYARFHYATSPPPRATAPAAPSPRRIRAVPVVPRRLPAPPAPARPAQVVGRRIAPLTPRVRDPRGRW